jgi:tetratricopeptide (TPR) repeat protein
MADNSRQLAEQSYHQAQSLAQSGEYPAAIAAYTRAIAENSDHVQALVGRGLALQRLGEHTKAIEDFNDAQRIRPDWPGKALACYGRAMSRHALGQLEAAIADCGEAIQLNSEAADARYLRGIMHQALGQLEHSANDLTETLRIDSNYAEAYVARGALRESLQQWYDAVADFSAALERLPPTSELANACHYRRGMAFQELSRNLDAIADFTKVIERLPTQAAAYLRRARSYAELGESSLAEADLKAGRQCLAK